VVTGDIRLSDARNPLPGSSNYVQNTNTPQAGVNFSIGGTGTANILNATTQFNLGGSRILSNAGMDNMFVGVGAGASNIGARNAFFGHMAGPSNTSGVSNTFFGTFAGTANTIGNGNSFFGRNAGSANIVGSNNTFIGNDSNFNSANPTGLNNTLLGAFAQVSTGVNFSTAIGESSQVTQSNSIVLGKPTTKVGIGTSAPQVKLHVKGASEGIRIEGQAIGIENGAYLSFGDAAGTALGYVGDGSGGDNSMYLTSYVGNVNLYTPVGAVLTASSTGNVTVLGGPAQPFTTALQVFDNNNGPYKGIIARSIFIDAIPGNGFDTFLASPVHVCARIEALGAGFGGYVLVRCTAARAPKSNEAGVQPFSGGIDIIRRLNPLSFRSKADGPRDVGLNAEDVASVEPSLVTRTDSGAVEDVKEGALDLVFINAFKQQQEQIKTQQDQIQKQQQQIDALKKLVCAASPQADLCRGEN